MPLNVPNDLACICPQASSTGYILYVFPYIEYIQDYVLDLIIIHKICVFIPKC